MVMGNIDSVRVCWGGCDGVGEGSRGVGSEGNG